jgi:putative metalloenzyme radical SAM/SPASM domain maturase
MPPGATIGFQTNGMLMGTPRAQSLVDAGVNLICLSLDTSVPQTFSIVRAGGALSAVQKGLNTLRDIRGSVAELKIGVEIVLRRDTLSQLAETLKWAAENGADFAIVTHLIAYGPEMVDQVVFDPNTDDARKFFELWQSRARKKGLEIKNYAKVRWKYTRTKDEQRLVDFVDRMLAEAAERDIFFHFKNLLNWDPKLHRQLSKVFLAAERVAAGTGLELRLPASTPRARKRCDFIDSGSAFVSANGDVHPCYFLWHRYQCFVSGWRKHVTPRVFGNLNKKDIITIWNEKAFIKFRKTVSSYDYPLCSNCNLAPCDYIDTSEFEQDCYTNDIPCCDCQWCLGVFQCLQ